MNKYKKEILDRLAKANEILKSKNLYLDLVIVGGSAFVLKDLIPRATYDIDSLTRVPSYISEYLEDIDINSDVLTFEATFGEWENDIQDLSFDQLSNIKIKSISTERLVVSRCFSRKKIHDIFEIIKNTKLNQTKFESIFEEVRGYTDPLFNNEFFENEELIKEIYNTLEWNYETSNIKNLYKR